MTSQSSREEWLAALAVDLGKHPATTDIAVAGDLADLTSPEIAKATLIAGVAHLHASGYLLESICDRLISGNLLSTGSTAIDTFFASTTVYRAGQLPGPEWWDPGPLSMALLQRWSSLALEKAGRAEVEEILARRWLIEESSISTVCEPRGCVGPTCTEVIEQWAASDVGFAQLWESAQQTVVAAQEVLPEVARDHRDLRDIAVGMGLVLELVGTSGESDNSGNPLAVDTVRYEADLTSLVLERLRSLSLFEANLAGASAHQSCLLEAAERSRKRLLVTEMPGGHAVPNGLADRLDGSTLAPDWLREIVFSMGGRSGLHASGPTAYLWLALEPHELPVAGELPQVTLGLAEEGRGHVELLLMIGALDDPLVMGYSVGTEEESLSWLALLLLAHRLTIDIFEVEGSGSLRLLERFSQDASELASRIEPTVLELLEGAGPLPLIRQGEFELDIAAAFGMSENAKSELLLILGVDDGEELAHARHDVLSTHMDRARVLHSGGDPTRAEARTEAAMRGYAEALSRRRPAHPDGVLADGSEAAHRKLVRDFGVDGLALLHYNYKGGRLQGFWSAGKGNRRGWISGAEVDPSALGEALAPWLTQGHGDVECLLRAAEPLAAEIEDAFAGEEIEEVLVMPWGPLHGIPFGAIPLGPQALGDRYQIAYAPSLGIVRSLLTQTRPNREAIELVSAHGGSLRWADRELSALRSIYPDAEVVADGSPREGVLNAIGQGRIVHLAMHGHWWRDDHFASALDLRLEDPFDRFIPAAEIHRDVDLGGAELVFLSACNTGRSPTIRHGIEFYAGLDAAFLSRGAKAVISTLWPIEDLAAAIFATSLHCELAAGQSLVAGFSRSWRLLRGGEVHNLPEHDHIAKALDAADPEWRKAAANAATSFRHPSRWAAFKLSGVPWASRPLPDQIGSEQLEIQHNTGL